MPGDKLFVEARRWILAGHEKEKTCRQSHGRECDPRSWKPRRPRVRSLAAHRFRKGLFLCSDGRSYPAPQCERGIEPQAPIFEKLPLPNDSAIRGCASAAAAQMLLHRKRVCRVELAIGKAMEQKLSLR